MSKAIKTVDGTNPDGSDHYQYSWSPEEFLGGIVFTGPIAGAVTLRDGAVYDVTDEYVDCLPEHNGALNCVLHRRHNAIGTPGYGPHVCSDFCGIERQDNN